MGWGRVVPEFQRFPIYLRVNHVSSYLFGISRSEDSWYYLFSDDDPNIELDNGPTRFDFADRVNHQLCFEGFEDLV